jgi:hypothetical protein
MAGSITPRRGGQRPEFVYWPWAAPFLLAAGFIAILLAAFLLVGVLSFALAVYIPVARLSSRAVRMEPYISVFGLRYFDCSQSSSLRRSTR